MMGFEPGTFRLLALLFTTRPPRHVNNIWDRYLLDCHSAQNNSSATTEIEWRISQKYNDDICLPLCLLFIICSRTSPPPPANWAGYRACKHAWSFFSMSCRQPQCRTQAGMSCYFLKYIFLISLEFQHWLGLSKRYVDSALENALYIFSGVVCSAYKGTVSQDRSGSHWYDMKI